MLRRNGPFVKSVELVLRLEGSLWWEGFVKEVVSLYSNKRCLSFFQRQLIRIFYFNVD